MFKTQPKIIVIGRVSKQAKEINKPEKVEQLGNESKYKQHLQNECVTKGLK